MHLPREGVGTVFRSESFLSLQGRRLCMYDQPQTLAVDRSVNALWPLAAGCHHIYIG